MKHLYIWNDMKLFCGSEVPSFEEELLRALSEISPEVSTHYITLDLFNEWVNKELYNIKDKKVISIGTRPNLGLRSTTHSSIYLDRVIDHSGQSTGITFRGDSENILKKICQSENEIHFLEDVLVGGNTIKNFVYIYYKHSIIE